ncbi:MAG TPA: heme-binding domain-containing protein, partial [Sediminibacterium sp.]|nr:heme-binding domain-containing protein [Sediminibacterium sp.]
MRFLKRTGIVLLVILLVMQAFRPARNNSNENSKDISKDYPVPTDVQLILAKACNDCHTNQTRYPWYAEVQPVSWWLNNHIVDGKRHLNFSEFSGYRIARQYKKLEECM